MGKDYTPTAVSIMESLAKLIAHQNGGSTVEDLVISKKNEKKEKPA